MTTQVRERPILFSGEMVRAILPRRKAQTRRVVKGHEDPTKWHHLEGGCSWSDWEPAFDEDGVWRFHSSFSPPANIGRCPYGEPGDRLWVRETWTELLAVSPATDQPVSIGPGERLIEPPTKRPDGTWRYDGRVIAYRANSDVEFCDGDGFSGDAADRSDIPKWRPSIHMPRWASRITLEVTGVRVERLNEISEADAKAEGVNGGCLCCGNPAPCGCDNPSPSHQDAFIWLWDALNANRGYPWESNPWVWVVEFKQLEASDG